MFTSLHVISPNWLEKTTSKIVDSLSGNVRIDLQHLAANPKLRNEGSRKIEKKLAKKSNAIMTGETEHEKLKTKSKVSKQGTPQRTKRLRNYKPETRNYL
eukprot:187571-Ditylum_brightwellii.AAC.1